VILKTAVTALLSSYCYGEIMKIFTFFMSLLVFSVTGQETRAQTTIVITKAECDRLVTHVASADVAYTPGVDVNGNAVAPAYLNPQP